MEITTQFNFFQAVRLLQRNNHSVQFLADRSSQFYEADIVRLDKGTASCTMTLSFMLLAGSSGIMPDSDFAMIQRAAYSKSPALFDLINLLNHHLIKTLYQAWHYYYATEQRDRLKGLLTHWLALKHKNLVYYSHLLQQTPLSKLALTQLLEDYFDVSVEIEENTGSWLYLNESQQHQSPILGKNILLGKAYWNPTVQFTLSIGPLSFAQYCSFLPNQPKRKLLDEITNAYTATEHRHKMLLRIKQTEIPKLKLSKSDKLQLGRHTWL